MYVPDVKKMFACGSNIKIALTNFTDDEFPRLLHLFQYKSQVRNTHAPVEKDIATSNNISMTGRIR